MISKNIEIINAYENNLKNISLSIPKNKLVAITGPSGSGKSTLAMDILQRECQRQYMESLGLVTDGLNKPKVDKIIGLSPAIGISQRSLSGGSNSNVGTYTEILTYLRVMFAKLGEPICPSCQDTLDSMGSDQYNHTCQDCGKEVPKLTMGMFSFNKPEGACPVCKGLGEITEVDLSKVVNENLTIGEGAFILWSKETFAQHYKEVLIKCSKHYGFDYDPEKKVKDYNGIERLVFYDGVESEEFKKLFPNVKKPKKVHDGYFKGVRTFMNEKAVENSKKLKKNSKITNAFHITTCRACNGERLGYIGRNVKVKGKTIIELSKYDLAALLEWLNNLELTDTEKVIVENIHSDLTKRIGNIIKIGMGYLSIDRPTSTLSGGEAQRLKLANIIDSGLTGVLYVLDEPTTGLHPDDVYRLLNALTHIRDLGNTVVVIEHDMDFVKECDFVIDFGPESGVHGGEVVFSGTPLELERNNSTYTAKYLRGREKFELSSNQITKWLEVKNAHANNLRNVDVKVPLGSIVSFVGVSGSGKSSLVFEVIKKHYEKKNAECDSIKGLDSLNQIVAINQKAIGRMTRSNIATYTDLYTPIRELFATTTQAKINRLKPSDFSFNVKGGRCEHCQGLGVVKLDMHFLDDIVVKCPVCEGKRFKDEVLEVKYHGYNISEVLNMTVNQSVELFEGQKNIKKKLAFLVEVGLGYLRLGQTTITLSGGECQRIKLARELSKDFVRNTLYILDEPTTGLHPKDISLLIKILKRLKEKGSSIFIIEHSLELIAISDYVIELGPKGGTEGGQITNFGTVDELIKSNKGMTSPYLRKFFEKEVISK